MVVNDTEGEKTRLFEYNKMFYNGKSKDWLILIIMTTDGYTK